MKLKMTLTMMTLALLTVFTVSIASAQSGTLPAPTVTTAANWSEPGQVVVSWNAVDEAAFYRIGWVAFPDYEATVAAGRDWLEAFHFLDAANTGQTEWTLTRLAPGVEYYFIVASNDARNGVAQYGAWSELLTLTAAPLVDYSDQYPNCDAVRAHHPGGVKQGSPVYRPALDRDGDGYACEPSGTTATPTTTPTGDPGDWVYFGPQCPDEYSNCASFSSDLQFISLTSYDHTNESFHDEPTIRLSCTGGDIGFTFDGGGPAIALGETGLSLRVGSDERTWFRTDNGSYENAWFSRSDSEAIVAIIANAEDRAEPLHTGASSDHGTVVASFDVTGFDVNLQRLDCLN